MLALSWNATRDQVSKNVYAIGYPSETRKPAVLETLHYFVLLAHKHWKSSDSLMYYGSTSKRKNRGSIPGLQLWGFFSNQSTD